MTYPRTQIVTDGYEAMGTSFAEGRDPAPMFFSSFPPETNTRLVVDAGVELVRDEVVTLEEPDGPVTFQWILARR